MNGRLLPWSAGSAAWNMALDEALLITYLQGASPPTLRFYGWDPPALSLGYLQQPLSSARQGRCREAGVAWVKRPTGGRGVFHQHELTYAFVAGERHGFTGPVLADYQRIGLGLKRGFDLLGLAVDLAAGSRPFKVPMSQACFANPSWYEITCQGRKLVGSAQLRRGKALLQHGSILFSFDPWFWREVWADRPTSFSVESGDLQKEVIGLAEALNHPPKRSVVISVLQQGLSEVLGVTWQEGVLTEKELGLATRLQKEKYTNSDWNNRRGRNDGVLGGCSGIMEEE